MSLNAREIALVVATLRDALVGSVVQRISTPARPGRLVLELRTAGTTHWLQLCVEAGSSRLGRLPDRPGRAERPHPFDMLLRREAIGARLVAIHQPGDDRAVRLDFVRGDTTVALVAELTGRHGNLFWLDGSGVIRGSFHPNLSTRRALVPGAPYTPLEPRPTARAESIRFPSDDRLEAAIERHFAALETEAGFALEVAALRRAIDQARQKEERLLAKLGADAAHASEADQLRRCGHVLQAHLAQVTRGMTQLETTDFSGLPCHVPLDARLGPSENLHRLFERAKRLERAAVHIQVRAAQAGARLAQLAGLATRLDPLTPAEAPTLLALRDELLRLHPELLPRTAPRRVTPPARLPYREYAIAAGHLARVGRSAADNDALTLRHCRPNDLWLHVRGRSGSHVVVPLGRGEVPSPEVLVDAAHLAAHFSDARGEVDIEVSWTARRYVTKPRGAPAGAVRLLREKCLTLRLEPARLAALLAP